VGHQRIREQVKSFLELNDNERTIYQKLWDTEKAVLRRKPTARMHILKHRKISSKRPNAACISNS
jgi:hypothetical protein